MGKSNKLSFRKPHVSRKNVPYLIAALLLVIFSIAFQKVPAMLDARKIKAAIVSVCPGATNIEMYKEEGRWSRKFTPSDKIYGARWTMPDGKVLEWTKETDAALKGTSSQSKDGVPDPADTDCE